MQPGIQIEPQRPGAKCRANAEIDLKQNGLVIGGKRPAAGERPNERRTP
jgi:hypothetical protein